MHSISNENYLKALYHLERQTERVTTTAIAETLEVTLPSATKMMKALAAAGLVEHVPYRGSSLTPKGQRAALRVIRKHRLIEVFLVEVLGYRWDEVHDEAERLEHAVSDGLADRIDAFLGFPTADPHGDPIPSASGELLRHDTIALADLPVGEAAAVRRVLDQNTEVLQYLAEIGLRPAATVTVLEAHPFEGPLRIRIDAEEAVLGRQLARRVLVGRAATG